MQIRPFYGQKVFCMQMPIPTHEEMMTAKQTHDARHEEMMDAEQALDKPTDDAKTT